jgi:hypothetical protein
MDNSLQQAIELVRQGKKAEGGRILAGLVKSNPDNELAWQWLAFCVGPEEQKRHCLKQALQINPKNEVSQKMLSTLDFSPVFDELPSPSYAQPVKPVRSKHWYRSTAVYVILFFLFFPLLLLLILTDDDERKWTKIVSGILVGVFVLNICAIGAITIMGPLVSKTFNSINNDMQSEPSGSKPAGQDATYCVKPESCFTIHGNGNTTLFGSLLNSCDKPIENISLKGTVTSQLDNSTLGSTTELKKIVLTPGQKYDYELTIKNSYFGELINCYPEAQSAYFVK